MVPQLSKDEQEKMEEKYIASRNAFYNGITTNSMKIYSLGSAL